MRAGAKRLKDAMHEVAHQIRAQAEQADSGSGHMNVAHRTNIKVATNVGQPNSTTQASATQIAPITQGSEDAEIRSAETGRTHHTD